MGCRWLLVLLLAGQPALIGCDDGGGGDGDADGDADGDLDADGESDSGDPDADTVAYERIIAYVYDSTPEWGRGEPIGGAYLAVDGPSGRQEYRSDDRGGVSMLVEEDAESFSITVAVDGRLPVMTWHEITFDDIARMEDAEEDGVLALVLRGGLPLTDLSIRIDATGVPPGHRFCASGAPMFILCGQAEETLVFERTNDGQPLAATGWTIDEAGRPVELAEVVPSGTGPARWGTLEFDGVSEVAPQTLSVTLLLPEDASSYFHTHGMELSDGRPFYPQDPETHLCRGGAHDVEVSADGAALHMSVTYFPLPAADIFWNYAIYARAPTAASSWPWSNRFFGEQLEDGGVYEVMDIPRIPELGAVGDLGDPIETQHIDGAQVYQLWLHDVGYTGWFWSVTSPNGPILRVPPLPAGLPVQPSWPARGTFMAADLWAFDHWLPDRHPLRPGIVELRTSRSPVFRLTFEW